MQPRHLYEAVLNVETQTFGKCGPEWVIANARKRTIDDRRLVGRDRQFEGLDLAGSLVQWPKLPRIGIGARRRNCERLRRSQCQTRAHALVDHESVGVGLEAERCSLGD